MVLGAVTRGRLVLPAKIELLLPFQLQPLQLELLPFQFKALSLKIGLDRALHDSAEPAQHTADVAGAGSSDGDADG